MFFWNSHFFDYPVDVGNLISSSSAFSKSSLNIWKFTVHVLLKPGLENFKHHFTSMWDECNCAVVWAFFGIAFLWDWNENWPFPVLWPLLIFPNFLAYWFMSKICKWWFAYRVYLCFDFFSVLLKHLITKRLELALYRTEHSDSGMHSFSKYLLNAYSVLSADVHQFK